ncbi:hypothetical protein KR054_003481 [Drosophila jambulina]|nr:hypothetical protein KR054_003481 [Drosophila jambulina]
MNSTSNLADVVRHYQRSIEKHSDNEKRLVHCMNKLFNLPIKFEHLQETGIGKTVNALRKFNGEVGQSAKTLITKWKAMVTAEEGSSTEVPVATSSQEEDSGKSNGRRSSDEDLDQENKGNSNSSSGEERQASEHRSRQEERSDKSSKQERSGSSKGHSKGSSDSSRKHKSSRHDKSKERDKVKDKEGHKEKKSNGEHKSRDSSQSISNKSSKSDGHKSEHSKSKHEKEKLHKDKSSKHHKSSSSKSSKRSHSPQRDEESSKAKIPKTKAKTEEDSPDGFDSSMGANFDDVLGMLNMPMSSKKSASGKSKSVAKTSSSSSSSTPGAPAAPSRDAFLSSRPTSTKKPELLAPSAKLEPLDPSIALELPTISNNYKPLPLNQTVMDVVFNQGGTQRSQASRFNESEALAQGISSKTMRTKIYSGVRTGQLLQVPSLFDLCTRILQKNLDALEYTGGVPFEILRTVLERATPQQLLNIEEYNPYLMDDSDILWQQHVQRHCRSQRREEMETWREMFLRCQEEKDRKLSSLAESIKASQKISEAPVRKTQLAFVDSMVKPPRSVMRKQEQYGTKAKLIATPAARVAALSSVTPNAAKVGDARLRVLAATRDTAQVAAAPRNKKAPLMAKTLQFMRGRHKR